MRQQLARPGSFRGAPASQGPAQLATHPRTKGPISPCQLNQRLQRRHPHKRTRRMQVAPQHRDKFLPLEGAEPDAGQQLREMPLQLWLDGRCGQGEQVRADGPQPVPAQPTFRSVLKRPQETTRLGRVRQRRPAMASILRPRTPRYASGCLRTRQ